MQDLRPDSAPTLPSATPAPATMPRRRGFLKAAAVASIGALAGAREDAGGALTWLGDAHAQTGSPPKPWWPSRWGAADEAGASNLITPDKVLDAVKWIRDGRIYRIGRIYEAGMPTFGGRSFSLRIPSAPTGGPFGENKLVYNDEYLATEIGQVGTQFDGLGHIGLQLGKDGDKSETHFYNGVTAQEMSDAYGLKRLGIEKIKPIFTRGHLIDAAPLKTWDVGMEITLADLRAALGRQGMNEADVRPGDALFFNTGWGQLWMKDNARFNSGEPGIGLEVARWVIEKQVVVVGADCWGVEAVPNPDKRLAFPVHGELITKNGIFLHESMVFDDLIRDRKYRFVYIFSPMPIKGGTGSAGGPIAVT